MIRTIGISTTSDAAQIVCSAGCKRTAVDQAAALSSGWENLPITGRWRCPQCWRELRAVNKKDTAA